MKRYLIGGAALLILSGCATQPKVKDEVAQVPQTNRTGGTRCIRAAI